MRQTRHWLAAGLLALALAFGLAQPGYQAHQAVPAGITAGDPGGGSSGGGTGG